LSSYENSKEVGAKMHNYSAELRQVEKLTEKLMGKFLITITFCSRLGIEHGSRHWKGVGKWNLNIHPKN
jgi:hypothetical protein